MDTCSYILKGLFFYSSSGPLWQFVDIDGVWKDYSTVRRLCPRSRFELPLMSMYANKLIRVPFVRRWSPV